MAADPVVGPLAEQLLGEIEARIVGMQYYDAIPLDAQNRPQFGSAEPCGVQ